MFWWESHQILKSERNVNYSDTSGKMLWVPNKEATMTNRSVYLGQSEYEFDGRRKKL